MNDIECFFCKSQGVKGKFKRFIHNGIHYKCGTDECRKLQKTQLQESMELARKKEDERILQKKMKFNELWGDYVYNHKDDFIMAERQYRDASRRMVDPYSLKIFRFCNFTQECSETSEQLTSIDMKNVRKKREELVTRGETFNTPIDSDPESSEIEDEEDDSDNKYLEPKPTQKTDPVQTLNVNISCLKQMYSRLKTLGDSKINDDTFCVCKIQYVRSEQFDSDVYMFRNQNDGKVYVFDDITNHWFQDNTIASNLLINNLTSDNNDIIYGAFVIHKSKSLDKFVATELIRGTCDSNDDVQAFNAYASFS